MAVTVATVAVTARPASGFNLVLVAIVAHSHHWLLLPVLQPLSPARATVIIVKPRALLVLTAHEVTVV